jgi:hypothetical protein
MLQTALGRENRRKTMGMSNTSVREFPRSGGFPTSFGLVGQL